jgi:phosphoglycolate phosphatase-like HAD superfamily hydrolase
MLDRDIIRSMLKNAGAGDDVVESNMKTIVSRAQKVYVDVCPDLSGRTCPGSLEILQALHEEGIPTGLVTGNLTAIAWKKMESAGLRPYLEFGAFAEMGDTRADLVRIAMELARHRGLLGDGTVVSLIGDHLNDVDAARRNGIRAVAVCTGVLTRQELEASRPDLLVDDLRFLRVADLL